jgi:hypothetical protein
MRKMRKEKEKEWWIMHRDELRDATWFRRGK